MSLTIKDVENLANLARIELSEDEKKSLLKDLESILAYVEMIQEVELPEAQTIPSQRNVWREDIADSEKYVPDKITAQFPESKDGYLKVKKIL